MKKIIPLSLALTMLVCCRKTSGEPDPGLVNLTIVSTNTPSTQVHGQDIVSNVRSSGSNLCYNFEKFDVIATNTREFEIRSKGTYPAGNPVCAQAIYYKDTTLKINTTSSGQYILRFYNNNLLFKADTVQVN